MTGQLYLHKAMLQFSRGQQEKGEESLRTALETAGDDQVSAAQAHTFWGEWLLLQGHFQETGEHLYWVAERAEEWERNWNDLLEQEAREAETLLGLLQRCSPPERE